MKERGTSLPYGLFAVGDATDFELTYKIPENLKLETGAFCLLPVRTRKCVGVFLNEVPKPEFKCRSVESLLPFSKPFGEVSLNLARWFTGYYLSSLSRTVRIFAPGFLWDPKHIQKREKRFSEYFQTGVKTPFPTSIRGELKTHVKKEIVLSDEQENARLVILKNKVTLLHGITGSGKTEVYLKTAEEILAQGKNILILVPEIALTPQMSARFRAQFGSDLAILHSGLTSVEYEREYFRIQWGECRVVLGVRSAVFAPLQNIGLIVVDEEHDNSYKNEEFPCYQARDVAVKRSQLEGALCVLGSATPSLESFYNAQTQKYTYVKLERRVTGALPSTEIVDAKKFLSGSFKKNMVRSSLVKFSGSIIAPEIVDVLKQTYERGEQSMVILNRRGFSNYCLCSTCGNALRCPHCAVSTTLHKRGETELCHYCGFTRKTLTSCPECSSPALVAMGAGTQSVEAELESLLPQLKFARLDRDVLTSNTRLVEVLTNFAKGETHCLIGTQLLAKGHDYSKTTTVVILHVEDALFIPDFRASERTFQLVTQASGRAGRGAGVGTVILQSLITNHPVIELAIANDVNGFADRELQIRRGGWLPPFTRQILIEFAGKNESATLQLAKSMKEEIIKYWKSENIPPDDARLVGPHPATLERLREEYRFHICVSSLKKWIPQKIIPMVCTQPSKDGIKVRVDVDPYSFL